jgi:hypothetical protein
VISLAMTYSSYSWDHFLGDKEKKSRIPLHHILAICTNTTYIDAIIMTIDDIQTIHPQIQGLKSHIFDQKEGYTSTATIDKMHWIWNNFSQHILPNLTISLQPPPQEFAILWLIQRYVTIPPK